MIRKIGDKVKWNGFIPGVTGDDGFVELNQYPEQMVEILTVHNKPKDVLNYFISIDGHGCWWITEDQIVK